MTTLGFIILGFGLMFGTSNGLSGISPQWQRPRRTPVGALPAGMINETLPELALRAGL
jgi:hypothetical protein